MIFYRHFDIPLLDADIPLRNDCAAVLQKMLYKGNVIAVIFVNEIRDAMEEWLEDYIIQLETNATPAIDSIETALETVRGQLSTLQSQQESICEYLEKGIYTIEMFTKRNLALAKEIKQLQESEDNLLKQKSEGKQKETAQTQIIPVAQHILESYPILSLEERNRLWKLVLKKATIYRSPDNEVTIRIYPNLPR